MASLVVLRYYHTQKQRKRRLRRRRDGITDHIHTSENTSSREINDFLYRLQETIEHRIKTKRKPEVPQGKKKFVFALRMVKFNPYEENIITAEKLLLQGPSRPLIVMTEKFQRHLKGKRIYAALLGWGYAADALMFRDDTETEDEPHSEPENISNNTQLAEKTILCHD